MNIKPCSRTAARLLSASTKDLIEKLRRLSRKLGALGYSREEINKIIMTSFLNLPYSVDWFDLSTTEAYYSLKAKADFKTEDSELILCISKYLLALPEDADDIANQLMDKLEFNCSLLGFDLETDESGSSEDSSTFMQIYKTKLSKCYNKQVRLTPVKRPLRSGSRLPAQKKICHQQIKIKKKVVKDSEPLTEPEIEKKRKVQKYNIVEKQEKLETTDLLRKLGRVDKVQKQKVEKEKSQKLSE